MVELGREALDISENITNPLTVTGGLPFLEVQEITMLLIP